MESLMRSLHAAEPDPLLGLMAAVRADDRPDKVDLGVGIYKDEKGLTPVMQAVKTAEELLLTAEDTKAYEGPQGNLRYGEGVERLVFGEAPGDRTVFATPGGCGALFIGFELCRAICPDTRVFLSQPSWPNHHGVANALGLETIGFDYRTQSDGSPDLDRILKGLSEVRSGDVVLLQGPCHNPTGTDLTAEQWCEMARFITERGALPFIDIAYQGFGAGLDADLLPVRSFLSRVPEAVVSYSCSKNFGLYRERTGALLVQAPDEEAAETVRGQIASLVRSSYSMPPSHGPAIVSTILDSPQLSSQWMDELGVMRRRLNVLRSSFAAALAREADNEKLLVIGEEKGMFSILPLPEQAILQLREESAIYLPGSGRVNVAGLREDRIDDVAALIAPHLVW